MTADKKKVLVIGVIGADVHAVGNKILYHAFTEAGFEVVNLGVMVSQEEYIAAAIESNADAIVVDYTMAKATCGNGDYADFVMIEGIELAKEEYAIGFRVGSDMTEEVNAIIDELIEDSIIDAKYFGTDNFMGRPANGYEQNLVVMSKEAAEEYGLGYNLVAGANIAGFKKVATAMMEQGCF